ncbi:MAG: Rpn family recombination-promoting nuclease/putative transposase [Myxococcota bacterium]|nr:Rpn family recombination-promoting nuclease/putative transposase [Myxococcota bacterium]
MATPPPTPHDALFKRIFSDPRNAAAELRAILPPATLAALDLSTLRLEPGSFVDEELRSRHTDLLFSVSLRGRRALIYVLLEHQSERDRWMPLRLLHYEARIWDAHLLAHPGTKKLPIIIPIVIQHAPRGWKTPLDLADLLDLPDDEPDREALAPFVPRFSYLVDDLTAIDIETLGARVMESVAKLALAALRDVRGASDLELLVERWSGLIRALREPTEFRAMDAIIRYILAVKAGTDVHHLAHTVRALSPELAEQIMSTAKQLIEQGRAEGRQEGRQEGLQEALRATLLRLLVKRFGALPADVRARIEAAGPGELDRWTDGLMEAATVEELLATTPDPVPPEGA